MRFVEKGVYDREWKRLLDEEEPRVDVSDVPACSAVTLRTDPTHPDHKETQPHIPQKNTHQCF